MKTESIQSVVNEIKEKLKSIEDHMVWLIKPDSRFWKKQRVEWSRRAREQGWPRRKIAQKGTVLEVRGFTIVVKLDGMKHAKEFHHAFFNPVSGPKLF